jgi:hypothetical protein
MSEYREECVKHKLVQRGILEQRPVPNSKKSQGGEWLTVYYDNRSQRWMIWHSKGYKFESDARKIMDKMIRYWPMYIVHRKVFETFYQLQRFN